MLTLAGHQVPAKAALSLPSSAGQREKSMVKRFMGRDKVREMTLQLLSQTRLGEISLIYYKSNQNKVMRSKAKS